MDTQDERIRHAVDHTEILRLPKQHLDTFGSTNIYYYMVTEPAYSGLMDSNTAETVIREGKVIAERPKIVTPYYLSHIEGFSSSARKYFETLINTYGANVPGLLYAYRNEPKQLNIVSDNLASVVSKLNQDIDRRGDPLTTIIKGEDELWDVSLLKFIYELTRSSLPDNLSQLGSHGLLDTDSRGIPADVRMRINHLFRRAMRGEVEPKELKEELDRWGLFQDYEDRFFSLFRK